MRISDWSSDVCSSDLRDVVAQTRAAYASWRAAREVIESSQVAVDAARLSLEGVRAENTVGTRTILDILNAEQEYLNAQVMLVSARRDAYVAGFTLLAARSEEHTSELQSLMRISYAVFCLQ